MAEEHGYIVEEHIYDIGARNMPEEDHSYMAE